MLLIRIGCFEVELWICDPSSRHRQARFYDDAENDARTCTQTHPDIPSISNYSDRIAAYLGKQGAHQKDGGMEEEVLRSFSDDDKMDHFQSNLATTKATSAEASLPGLYEGSRGRGT